MLTERVTKFLESLETSRDQDCTTQDFDKQIAISEYLWGRRFAEIILALRTRAVLSLGLGTNIINPARGILLAYEGMMQNRRHKLAKFAQRGWI